MRNNFIIKLLASIPVILITLYFIPFLGVCLIFLRNYIYINYRKFSASLLIAIVGVVLLIPKAVLFILETLKLELNIPYISNFLSSDIYNVNLINYSKRIICIGIILFIISFILKNLFNKLSNKLTNSFKNYMNESQQKDYEISKKNDMKIKEKQLRTKNTSHVECPNCGADTLLSEKFGVCKYCRSKIENKNYKD